MKKSLPKKLRSATIKPQVATEPSKPAKTGLSKSDPDYYSKIGKLSAARRKLSSQDYSEMARLSHGEGIRDGYHGGRPKKEPQE